MKIKKAKYIVFLIVIGLVIMLSALFIINFFQHYSNKDNREAMLTIFEKSFVGMNIGQFWEVYVENKSHFLKINLIKNKVIIVECGK